MVNTGFTMKILGREVELEHNLRFSLRHHRLGWLVLLVTIFLDYKTTLMFIAELGIGAEGNWLISWLMVSLGVVTGLIIGKSLQFIAVVIFVSMDRRIGNLLLLLVIALNCWAVVINTSG